MDFVPLKNVFSRRIKRFLFGIVWLVFVSMSLTSWAKNRPTTESIKSVFIDKDVVAFPQIQETPSVFQLITHGRSGELLINGEWKNVRQIAEWLLAKGVQRSAIGSTANSRQPIAHLNIYGCEFAKGAKGLEAVAYLEKTLGVSVSASNNLTGKDGDWILEVGNNENVLIFKNYSSNLQCPTTVGNNTGGNTYATNLSSAYTQYSGYSLANAFDGNTSTYSYFYPSITSADLTGQNIFGWGTPLTTPISSVVMTMGSGYYFAFSGSTIVLQGSNDNSTWTNLSSAVSAYSQSTITLTNTLSPNTAYKYYRIAGVSGTGWYGYVSEVKPYYYTSVPALTGTTTICQSATSQLLVNGSVPTTSTGTWSSSNTSVATVSTTGVVTAVSAGTSTITFVAANGCTQTTMITVNAKPTVTTSSNVSMCSGLGNTTTLTASGASTYSWTPSTGLNTTTGSSVIANPTSTTTYTVTGTGANGCTNTANVTVTITGSCCPAGNTAMTLSSTVVNNICPLYTADISGLVTSTCPGGTSLEWHTSSTPSSANLYTTPTTATAGTYYPVCYSSSSNCYSPAPTTGVTVTIINCPISLTNTCPSNTVNLNTALTSTTAAPQGTTLTWHTATPVTTTNTVTDPTQVGAGTYYASFYDATNNCYGPVSVAITVTINTTTAPTITPASTSFCAGGSDVLTANGCSGTVLWSTGATTSAITVTTAGSYTVTCTVSGCISSPSAASTVTVITSSTPTGLSASPTSICSGSSSNLSGTACTTGTLTWYSDSGLTTTLASTTVSPGTTTTYYAACVNGTCKSPSGSVTVTVTTTPTAPTGLSASSASICSGYPTTLNGTCSLGTLTWYSDAGLTTTIGATQSPKVTTTYYAACVNGSCVSLTANTVVTVNANSCPNLATVKTASVAISSANIAYTYTLTVYNTGGVASSSTITIKDTLATGLTYTSGTGTGWTCMNAGTISGGNTVVSCSSTTVLAANTGVSSAITLSVSPNATAASSPIYNTAWTSGGGMISGAYKSGTTLSNAQSPTNLSGGTPTVIGYCKGGTTGPILIEN